MLFRSTVRTATLAHRAEMLDDHATDSNHKKMLGMPGTLCLKSREAHDISIKFSKLHVELTAAFGPQAIERWEDEVTTAESLRLIDVKVMDMYATRGSAMEMAAGSGTAAGSAMAAKSATVAGSETAAMSARMAMATASTFVQSVVEEWIDFAIIFEQMQ